MKTIEEKNRIIYSFMGDDGRHTAKELKYHTSWDWLMPVIDKIYNLPQEIEDTNLIGDITNALIDIDILECHGEVVYFIEYYNEQN